MGLDDRAILAFDGIASGKRPRRQARITSERRPGVAAVVAGGQLSGSTIGGPVHRSGPTRSKSGGTHGFTSLGGGHPLAGQLCGRAGMQALITAVPGSRVQEAGQSASDAHVEGSGGGVHVVVP